MISRFLRELKRRRVLRTASLYVLGAWVALQVVEVLSGAGLPPATMRNLLILLSCGFPLALIVGWFFEISAEGITRTGSLREGESLPELKFIDHVLLVGLVLVVAIDVYILSFPPPSEPVVQTGATGGRTIAVLGFEDLQLEAGEDPVGDGLAGEIRDSLARVAGLRVLGPQSSSLLRAAAPVKHLTLVTVENSTDTVVSEEIITEAYRRLGIEVTIRKYPESWASISAPSTPPWVRSARGMSPQFT